MRLRLFRIVFLPILLLCHHLVMSQEQTFDGCLSHDQLYELYSGNVQTMGQMMGKQRFFMVSNDQDVTMTIGKDTLVLNLCNWQFAQGFNDIYVNAFYKEGFYNFVEYNTSGFCAKKLLKDCKEKHLAQYNSPDSSGSIPTHGKMQFTENIIADTGTSKLYYYFKQGYQIVFPEDLSENGQHLIQIYNPLDFKRLVQFDKTQREQQYLARQIKEQTIMRNMAAADSLAQQEKYPEAIRLLEEVYDVLPEYMLAVDTKLGTIKQQYKEKKIQTYTAEGEKLYNSGDYQGALDMYYKVLKEDINNQNANDRIAIINRKIDVLQQRRQVTFEYRESNPHNYAAFREALEGELNQLVNNTPDGNLHMDYSILFDTMGINQSFYNIISFNTVSIDRNLPVLQARMSNLLGHKSLQPSYREEIPIRSAATFRINLEWDSYEQVVIKKRKKIVNKSTHTLDPVIENLLQNNPSMYYGKYHFNTKYKNCNAEQFHDISLTKYSTVGGEAFIYGLFPGLGTLIATQGKEGAACMALSLILYGGAATAYAFYKDFDKQYTDKIQTLDEKETKPLKTKKEICKWSAIAGVSIGGTIHLSGMIKALVRGIQNKKASKELRQALKKEPMEIQKEDIHIQ